MPAAEALLPIRVGLLLTSVAISYRRRSILLGQPGAFLFVSNRRPCVCDLLPALLLQESSFSFFLPCGSYW